MKAREKLEKYELLGREALLDYLDEVHARLDAHGKEINRLKERCENTRLDS